MKMNASVSSFVAVTALFLSSCSTPPPVEVPKTIDMDALKTEIQAMEDAYSAAEKAKDAPAVAAYYSDDAISYGRNSEPLSGKQAITEHIADRLAKDTLNNSNVYKVVDLYADGDMAVEIGSWEDINAAGEVVNHGHYMSYFQKRDGKYVCVRDMNVSSVPDKKEEM